MKLPQGFFGAATAAGLKSTGAKDLTVIVNQGPKNWASAVFTTNQVIAAPVIWSKEVIKGSAVRAVVLIQAEQMPAPAHKVFKIHIRAQNI